MDILVLPENRRGKKLYNGKYGDQETKQYISVTERHRGRQYIVWRRRIREKLGHDRNEDTVADKIKEYREENDRHGAPRVAFMHEHYCSIRRVRFDLEKTRISCGFFL